MNEFKKLQNFPNFVAFQTETGKMNVDVFFHNDTLWLTLKKIAELFEKDRSVTGRHLKKIFMDGELNENVVCAIKGKLTKLTGNEDEQ